jgi:hypothetical protein
MAFSTYTELKSAIADNAHRDDLTNQIVDAVAMCEARMYDLMILRDMESDEALTLTQNQNYVALPAGFISPIKFWLVVSTVRIPLQPLLPQDMPYYTSATQPKYWAIDGDNILFDCPASSAYSAYLRCVKKSNLSGSTATNYILAQRPDIYLAGSLSALSRYTGDNDLFNTWEPLFVSGVREFKARENRARGIVPLRTDIYVHSRSNIIRGD